MQASSKATLPIHFGITLWLLLDRLAVPGWAHGAAWTLFAGWCAAVVFWHLQAVRARQKAP